MKPTPCLSLLGLALCDYRTNSQDRGARLPPFFAPYDNNNIVMFGDIVMFGEHHACKQQHESLRILISTPEFADRVDDIVVELGNSLKSSQLGCGPALAV